MIFCAALLSFICTSYVLSAQESINRTVLDVPLTDLPYNVTNDGRFPSMYQSLEITKDVTGLSHRLFSLGYGQYPFTSLLLSGLNDLFFLSLLPGGDAWVHEEGHRAVMGQYGISSYNDVYKMDLMSDMISVSHVKDADLAWLKANHPADMVRLHSAGIEMEYEWIDSSREDFFFSGQSTRFERAGWIFSELNSLLYIQVCTTSEADTETDTMNLKENKVSQRDFTGMDFTAWVYDLHRPKEPYAARGTHPLGNGYDRYIKYSDLTSKEKRYLTQQYYMSYLNFISPQFIGFDSFLIDLPGGKALLWNFATMHYLTSFGSSSELHLYMQYGEYNISTALRVYRNESLTLPGAEVSLHRFRFNRMPVLITSKISLWLQPHDQMFYTRKVMPGAGAEVCVLYPVIESFEIYSSLHFKNAGWQAGEVSLDPSADLRAGVRLTF
jgi:hypothetical protein